MVEGVVYRRSCSCPPLLPVGTDAEEAEDADAKCFIGDMGLFAVFFTFRSCWSFIFGNFIFQWIKFQAEDVRRNYAIGSINMCDWLQWSVHPKLTSFIAFNDLQPSRYAMSYIEESNHNAYKVQVAFIALDSENLGEMVDDHYHTDFGDNKFPYYKGNTNVRIDNDRKKYKYKKSDHDDIDSSSDESDIEEADIERVKTYIPQTILLDI